MRTFFHKLTGCNRCNILFFVFSLLVVLPFFYALKYSLPSADDFSYMALTKYSEHNRFVASVLLAVSSYKNWGGGWLGTFFQIFVLSFHQFGIGGLHVLLSVCMMFFLCSLYFLCRTICVNFFRVRYYVVFYFLVLLVGFNAVSPRESLYWAVGSTGYIVPFSFAFCALSFLVKYLFSRKNIYYVLMIVFGVIVCSSTLPAAGLINATYLLYAVGQMAKNKKTELRAVLPFLLVFAAALIIALAPGNFVRHSFFSKDGMHFFNVCGSTLIVLVRLLKNLLKNSFLFMGMACLFFFVLIRKRTDEKEKSIAFSPFFSGIIFLVLCYVFLFPVQLGYGGNRASPDRIEFMMYFIIAIFAYTFTIHLAFWCRTHFHTYINYDCIPFVVVLMLCFFLVEIHALEVRKHFWVIAVKELSDGTMKAFYEEGQKALVILRSTTDKNVVISGKKVESKILNSIALRNDPHDWVNKAVANFYGKEAVVYNTSEFSE
ncbi:MAG: hypothetical protein II921_09785 [Treponema sp.]|nr:hypothetical protein [Treponema sp.]